ncbi:hypothetical protein PHMEG_00019873 [Phytophthora megakarya]|uniref:Jacalin-type lectin domain-containing protein n=1 Tax=Phytophthora megakarya TaxID=4795 RepID=A0A225VRR9_9STRA|nr:hypothetical protein PHMEG_00019873 [Phytophthora megakarya]
MAPAAVMKPLQVLAWFLLVFVYGVLSADESVQLSESFGGPHGTEFSDQSSVAAGQTINSITVRAGERVDGVSLEVTAPTAATFSHGGTGGKENVLKLEAKEYITSMEAHWGEKKGRTRIFYLSFGTSAGHTVAGGSQTESKNTVMAPEGFQLGGFFGQDGEEIDKLGAIWTRISAEAPTETPAPAAPAPASGSEAPTESTAGSAASASEEDSAASDTLGSEAPKKKTPAKKKTINGSASEDTSTDGLADASGSGSEAPKKTTTVKKKTRVAASAASDEASAATSSDSFGSGAPTKKTPTKKKTSAKKKPAHPKTLQLKHLRMRLGLKLSR